MGDLRLVTWNVLHRVHAVNWAEPQAATFPSEPARVARIAALVAGWLAGEVDVVCLQEVSGDQLAALRDALGDRGELAAHRSPREPALRFPGPPVLTDASEYLVAAYRPGASRGSRGHTFEGDAGKGYVGVQLDRALVLSTHVSFAAKGTPQLELLAQTARGARGPVVIAGDINASREDFGAGLGADFALSDLSGQPPTRLGAGRAASRTIDHVAVLRGRVTAARVLDAEGLSDHAPVLAALALD